MGAMLLACVGMSCSANSRGPHPASIGGPKSSDTPSRFLSVVFRQFKAVRVLAQVPRLREQELFRQEPQPPVKDKNLDGGCHAPRLRGHVVFCQQPSTSPGFDWRAENIRSPPVFLALISVNSKQSGY